MIGSEKQVKWAEQIRQEALAWGAKNVKILQEAGLPQDFANDLEQKFQALVESKIEAKYWIENRKLQMGVPAKFQDDISEALKKQIPPLRIEVSPQYDLVWSLTKLKRGS